MFPTISVACYKGNLVTTIFELIELEQRLTDMEPRSLLRAKKIQLATDHGDEAKKARELTLPVCVIRFSSSTPSASVAGTGAPKANRIDPRIAKIVKRTRDIIMIV